MLPLKGGGREVGIQNLMVHLIGLLPLGLGNMVYHINLMDLIVSMVQSNGSLGLPLGYLKVCASIRQKDAKR